MKNSTDVYNVSLRKASEEPTDLELLDFFLLRTPRLPYHIADTLNAQRTPEELWRFLIQMFQTEELMDSIYLASESLYTQLKKTIASDSTAIPENVMVSLYKYAIRMSTRCTPFGKFAGIALGEITDSQSDITLSGKWDTTISTDMGFSGHLIRKAISDTDIAKKSIYGQNSSILKTKNHYRYAGYRLDNGRRRYYWIRLKRNELLDWMVNFTRQPQTYRAMFDFLTNNAGLTPDQAHTYLQKIIQNQLLFSQLEPNPITDHTLTIDTTQNPELLTGATPLNKLHFTTVYPRQVSTTPFAAEIAAGIPDAFKTDFNGPIIQADLRAVPNCNQLSKKSMQYLVQDLQDLIPLHRHTTSRDFNEFRKRFAERYDKQEVPLLEALDPDLGIGYGDYSFTHGHRMTLIKSLGLRRSNKGNVHESKHVAIIKDINIKKHVDKVELTPTDLADLSAENSISDAELPSTCYAMGSLIADSAAAIDNGNFSFVLHSFAGPSALPLMARFCHLDKQLEEKLQFCADIEQKASPDIIFAEIVFLPDDRTGNVMRRPNLHQYEISITNPTSVSNPLSIPVSDLWVSIKDSTLILRSKKLNKVIIPRSSSAHYTAHSAAIYRFLCDIQYQNHNLFIDWDWGKRINDTYLPRVTYRHIILHRAKWNIRTSLCDNLLNLPSGEAIKALRNRYSLPSTVLLVEGDNELLIDFDNFIAIRIFLDHLKKGDIILYENLSNGASSPVKTADGMVHSNQIILPLRTNGSISAPSVPLKPACNSRRNYMPGSEWAYLKIYTGTQEAEHLLMNEVRNFILSLRSSGILEKWFFVRYRDPEHHIRLRVLLNKTQRKLPIQEFSDAVNRHFGSALDNGYINRIQYDTYERELERYGYLGIVLCESIFELDSDATLELIPLLKDEPDDTARLLSAMLAIDDLFEGFKVPLAIKLECVNAWRNTFLNGSTNTRIAKRTLDREYRKHRSLIQMVLQHRHHQEWYGATLYRRYDALSMLLEGKQYDASTMASLAHMFINRHFWTNQQEYELTVYHLLAEAYRVRLYRTV